jgi:hypothetical protein
MVFVRGVVADIGSHARMALQARAGAGMPAHFLYFLVIGILAGPHPDMRGALTASVLVLAATVAAKFWLVRGAWLEALAAGPAAAAGQAPRVALWGAACLALAHNLIVPGVAAIHPYLGNFPPNVWHNSTTIAVAPFAFALFWLSYRYLTSAAPPALWRLVLLTLANVLIKPSYALVFVAVFPLFSWRRGTAPRARIAAAAVAGIGLVTIAGLSYFLYLRPATGFLAGEGPSRVVVEPLRVWSYLAPSVPLSLLASIAFPLAFVAAYARQACARPLFQYAAAHFLLALGMYALLAESGPRELHGNFVWQLVLCNFILFFVCALLLSEIVLVRGRTILRDRLLMLIGAAHVASGIYYLARLSLYGDVR